MATQTLNRFFDECAEACKQFNERPSQLLLANLIDLDPYFIDFTQADLDEFITACSNGGTRCPRCGVEDSHTAGGFLCENCEVVNQMGHERHGSDWVGLR